MERRATVSRSLRSAILGLAAAMGVLAGCASKQKVARSEEIVPAPAAAPAPAPAVEPAPVVAPPVEVRTESVYFDFDQSDVKPAGQELLSGFGTLMAKHPELHVRIEGNCDERGTTQYNLALGYRRADAAKRYLEQMGASADRITTVSYGEERPRAGGHDEEAWRQNRRDDLVPDRTTLPAAAVAGTP